ncbi:hypothetical protein ACFQGT_10790 [Natrialbaceae archaeon GCM10025810]|uniref:hypothetical protein n=1 Tax=Halovalidus salilacus TaxID=3075124 RepID=UPI0036215E79
MERRRFIAATGIGIGFAGCLSAGQDDEDAENGTTENGTDGDGGVTSESNGEADDGGDVDGATEGDEVNDGETDADDEGGDGDETGDEDESTVPATFEVASMATNSPVGGGELLVVDATIENVGDETGTTDIELVVGHSPAVEDREMLTLEPGQSAEITLEFRAGEPAGETEEFPVRVDTGAHEVSRTVVVEADGGGGEPSATFESCSRAAVSGRFEDGDVAFASTGFYDEAGFGNTLIEDGITFGDDVDAPFSGTVVFELADDGGVSTGRDEIVVSVSEYGEYGTAITGLTTEEDDYVGGGITHSNPHAEGCLREFEAEWEDSTGGGGEPTPATFEVASMATNSPVGGGELLVVDATIENVGDETGTTDIELVVGHSPAVEDREMLTLEPGQSAEITLEFRAGEPAGETEEFPVRVDTGAHEASETVTVEG